MLWSIFLGLPVWRKLDTSFARQYKVFHHYWKCNFMGSLSWIITNWFRPGVWNKILEIKTWSGLISNKDRKGKNLMNSWLWFTSPFTFTGATLCEIGKLGFKYKWTPFVLSPRDQNINLENLPKNLCEETTLGIKMAF